jgi:hypothetical protein
MLAARLMCEILGATKTTTTTRKREGKTREPRCNNGWKLAGIEWALEIEVKKPIRRLPRDILKARVEYYLASREAGIGREASSAEMPDAARNDVMKDRWHSRRPRKSIVAPSGRGGLRKMESRGPGNDGQGKSSGVGMKIHGSTQR